MASSPFPDNFIPKVRWPEYGVHQQLEVVACGGVAVEVDAAGGLEDAVQFDHALRHYGEVCHHVVLPEEGAHGGEQFADLAALLRDDILICKLGLDAPAPCVVECCDLRRGLLAAALAEQDVVGGVGVEGRVEVDEVNALVGDVLAQDV